MNSAQPGSVMPARPARSLDSKAVGITLAPGTGRVAALLIVGLTLVVIVLIAHSTRGSRMLPDWHGLAAGAHASAMPAGYHRMGPR